MSTPLVQLDDTRALNLLTAMVRPRLRAGGLQTELSPDLCHALAEAVGAEPAGEPPSEGDLARQALLVLADDPNNQEALTILAEQPPPERFDYGESIGVLLAALVVLQTHVRIERLPNGKWSVLFEKKASRDGLLKPLVQKLLALVSSPGNKP